MFYNTLVSSVREVIELVEEPEEDNPAPPSNEKDVASVKGKGKGRKVVYHASSRISTCSFTMASVQCIVGPAITVVGSPTATLFAPLPNPIVAPSHSDATILSVPRKRKVVAPDIFATSSERSSSLSLIENMGMAEHIEDLMKTKASPPAHRRIQEFITKDNVPSYCCIHSSHVIEHLFFYISFVFFLFKLDEAVLVQTPSLSFTRALIYSLQMCP